MTLRWGLAATGNIARTFATAVAGSASSVVTAVASRTPERAASFAADFSTTGNHIRALDYEALIADPAVEAIYVATPHSEHAEWVLRALRAGKHVLCEKPMGLNHPEVMAMVDAAADADRFLMEAFMYRCHPQIHRLKALLDEGAIGPVRQIRASFGFSAPPRPESRLFAPRLAGGGIMDVGCYPVSMACLIADSDPEHISAEGQIGDTGVDHWASATLSFADGLTAQLATGVTLWLENSVQVFGDRGWINLSNPWLGAEEWSFEIHRPGEAVEHVSGSAPPLYQLEIDHVAACVAGGDRQSPYMSHSDSLRNARVLDEWRRAIGLEFPQESARAQRPPLPTTFSPPAVLARPGNVPHVDKPVSRLVMGCDNQPGWSHAAVMWDNFISLGGNCFDTAHVYGKGRMETLLGHWQQSRSLRDDIVIIGKGAHTPDDNPEAVGPQLEASLTRLQTDYLDIYFLHRDNTDIPVGEFVDAVNAEIGQGRIRSWGGSNWTLARVQAANEYAERNGRQGMSAVSNNFSLAHMVNPLWPGVESATDVEFRAYLAATGMALMPWSSQGRGFFTPWAEQVMQHTGRENPVITGVQPTMAELAKTWFSEENFERRSRAVSLAEERGVSPIQIALAYVINQPFPCFPLIGPRQISETRDSLAALDIALSPAECRWLNLED